MSVEGVETVKKNTADAFERRRVAVYALSLDYAARALADFRKRQPAGQGVKGEFWTNQSGQARDRVFADAFRADGGDLIGWFIAHSVKYGVYLELANDRRNQALRKIVEKWKEPFRRDVKRLFGDS